jgi:hypothetical protein
MTVLTNMLELRLDKLLQRARQLQIDNFANKQGSLADDGRPWNEKAEYVEFWRSMDQCKQIFSLVMRELTGLNYQRARLQGKMRSVPHHLRWREQSRISSLDNDLTRVTRKAIKVSHLLMDLNERGGEVSLVDLIQGIHHLGGEMGKTLDHMQVHGTLQAVKDTPSFVTAPSGGSSPEYGGDLLFILVALLASLTRARRES